MTKPGQSFINYVHFFQSTFHILLYSISSYQYKFRRKAAPAIQCHSQELSNSYVNKR